MRQKPPSRYQSYQRLDRFSLNAWPGTLKLLEGLLSNPNGSVVATTESAQHINLYQNINLIIRITHRLLKITMHRIIYVRQVGELKVSLH